MSLFFYIQKTAMQVLPLFAEGFSMIGTIEENGVFVLQTTDNAGEEVVRLEKAVVVTVDKNRIVAFIEMRKGRMMIVR